MNFLDAMAICTTQVNLTFKSVARNFGGADVVCVPYLALPVTASSSCRCWGRNTLYAQLTLNVLLSEKVYKLEEVMLFWLR